MRALCAALLLVVACEKPALAPLKIRYAARTDNAPNGTNNTYFTIVEDEALFVVADADDPYTGKAAAEHFSAAFAKQCHGVSAPLSCALDQTHRELDYSSFSLGALAIAGHHAGIWTLGSVRVAYRHGDRFEVIDNARSLEPGDSFLLVNQRLLEVVGEARVRAALPEAASSKDQLEASVARLLDDAKTSRRPDDPATAILVQVVTTEPLP